VWLQAVLDGTYDSGMRTEGQVRRFAIRSIALAMFCGFITASAGGASATDDISAHVWRVRDGLPQNAVQALAQTPDGYLWIGTNGGLVRFDGSKFRLF
jgi:ligand-binding sensor domain-containing protein